MLKTQESTTFESIAEIDPIVSSTNWIKPLTSKQYFKFSMVQSFHCHALKNKNANHSIKKVQNLGNERRQMYKKPRQESSLCDISIICEIFGKTFYPNFWSFVWRRHVSVSLRGTILTHIRASWCRVTQKPGNSSVFYCKTKAKNPFEPRICVNRGF